MKPRTIETTSKSVAGLQIKLTFLQIMLDLHPGVVDFDLTRERIALPDTLHWNLFGSSVRELQIAKLIETVGVTRSARPLAKGGKRSLWKLPNPKLAAQWVRAYENLLPVEPQGRLFEQEGDE